MFPNGEFSYFLSNKTKWPFNNHMALGSKRSFIRHLFLDIGFLIKYTAVTELNEHSCFCGQSLLPSSKFPTAWWVQVPVPFLLSQGIRQKKKKLLNCVSNKLLFIYLESYLDRIYMLTEIFLTSHTFRTYSFSAELFPYDRLCQ